MVAAFFGKVDVKTIDDCWLWKGGIRSFSYGSFAWRDGKMWAAHRVAYEIATGQDIPEGMDICHRCDTPLCCNPMHLFPGTASENMADMHQKGRHNCASKLTAVEVRAIRRDYKRTGAHNQTNCRELAEKYGVSMACIWRAAKNPNAWKRVKRDETVSA